MSEKIEKLPIEDNTGAIERKINELVDAVNKLNEKKVVKKAVAKVE